MIMTLASSGCVPIAEVADPDPLSAWNWCEQEVSLGKPVGSNSLYYSDDWLPKHAIDRTKGTFYHSDSGFSYWWIDLLENWNVK